MVIQIQPSTLNTSPFKWQKVGTASSNESGKNSTFLNMPKTIDDNLISAKREVIHPKSFDHHLLDTSVWCNVWLDILVWSFWKHGSPDSFQLAVWRPENELLWKNYLTSLIREHKMSRFQPKKLLLDCPFNLLYLVCQRHVNILF